MFILRSLTFKIKLFLVQPEPTKCLFDKYSIEHNYLLKCLCLLHVENNLDNLKI